MFKILLIIYCMALASNVGATNISTEKDSYNIDETIDVTYSNTVSKDQDWIGIYPLGASNNWSNVVSWAWTDGTDNSSVFLPSIPTSGEYEARFFHSNSLIDEASYAFSVNNPDIHISTQDDTYLIDQSINVSYLNKLSGDQDWIGIYPLGATNDWGNVVSWSWTDGIENSAVSLDGISIAGHYEARIFLRNSFKAEAGTTFVVKESVKFGARVVSSTALEKGTLFASPNGNGNNCSEALPCSIQEALNQLSAGDVLFLRGGQYKITSPLNIETSGTENQPITIESYPGELAILDGQNTAINDIKAKNFSTGAGLLIHGGFDYIHIRKLEVKNMADAGIKIASSNNIVEGCVVHNNYYNGIHIIDGKEFLYATPFIGGYNIIRDNVVYDNTDVGLFDEPYADGGNSDGISISSSKYNQVIHNTVYSNSDDGIDTWRSNHAYIAYNIAYDNGEGSGDGNGVKAGSQESPDTGKYAIVEHTISYGNKKDGFNYNGGVDVTFRFNTAYNNGRNGFNLSGNTITEYNISSSENDGSQTSSGHANNSWSNEYMQENVVFLSTAPNSTNFLRPVPGSVFESMGAHTGL